MKKIKILTITLGIIAITMIAFFGIYTQVQNRMENQVKQNSYAMDIKGTRNVQLTVNTESTTTIKDAEGKVVENQEELTDEQIAEKGYTKEEKANNPEEVKNIENYKASQKVIEKRLQELGVENYMIRLEKATGNMLIELPENEETDDVISNINTTGKFEMTDSETKEVLMTNEHIKQAKVMYGSSNSSDTTSRGTTVYLDIEFNKEGKKKLEEISNKYVKVEENTEEENNTTEENTTTEENSTDTETTKEKKVTMKVDDQEIMSSSFEEPIKTGKLQLSIGSATTDTDTLDGYVEQASSMATILDTGNIPVKYDLGENQYVLSNLTDNEVTIAIYIALGIIVIALIVLVIRHKLLGILGVISYIGFISLFMLVIPYTNVILSIEGLLGMAIILALNYVLVNKLLAKANKRKEVYKEFFIKIMPIIILTITFCFMGWTPISSFGMAMFWGIILIAIYNSIITNNLLKIQIGKEK